MTKRSITGCACPRWCCAIAGAQAAAQAAELAHRQPGGTETIIPARAPVVSERIETEFRTASGITDGKGHVIAGVVLITAGYSAEGKYSHYFVSQVPLKVGDFLLPPGQYLIGWVRGQDSLEGDVLPGAERQSRWARWRPSAISPSPGWNPFASGRRTTRRSSSSAVLLSATRWLRNELLQQVNLH